MQHHTAVRASYARVLQVLALGFDRKNRRQLIYKQPGFLRVKDTACNPQFLFVISFPSEAPQNGLLQPFCGPFYIVQKHEKYDVVIRL